MCPPGVHILSVKLHVMADVERIKRPTIQTRVLKMHCVRGMYQSSIESTTQAESARQVSVHGVFVKVQADLHQATGCCLKNSLSMRSASASSSSISASTSCWLAK